MHLLLQAEVGSSGHGLLHTFLDDILEDTWCQDDVNWKGHSLAESCRNSSTTLQEAV